MKKIVCAYLFAIGFETVGFVAVFALLLAAIFLVAVCLEANRILGEFFT